MKRALIAFLVALALAGAYVALKTDDKAPDQGGSGVETYTSPELGIEFSYRAGAQGYVLEEKTLPGSDPNLLRVIVLMRTEDAEREPPVGGEGPPTITLYVFMNPLKQRPEAWANQHNQFTNLNLKIGEVAETVVAGANAIRYRADGLYASENVIVAHGENMYVVSGMYLDEDSALRRDFSPLVESIRFIRQPGQE